jgi:pimeloyl-ACP methyl ester carboxylesterase
MITQFKTFVVPHLIPHRAMGAALLSMALAGCTTYSSVSEKRPRYHSVTPAGQMIAAAMHKDEKQAIVKYLDAASEAAGQLRANPSNDQARQDYNFAVGRIYEEMHDAHLNPWAKAVSISGANGEWRLIGRKVQRPEQNPGLFRVLPADRYTFTGLYVNKRETKAGLGAPLVASGTGRDFTKMDRFVQGKHIYYGVTGLIRFEGKTATIYFEDPLSTEDVEFGGHRFPLAADYTAAMALALARQNPRKLEIARLLHPQKYAETARLARFQPYDPNKIPLICVHGLMDSPATWVPMINMLRSDPEIRRRYQVWFYSYPSGYPYPYSAAIMREQLDAINATYRGHKKVVLIGHSMGGVISRTMLTDSGMTLWNAAFKLPPDQIKVSEKSRELLTKALIFKHRDEVGRAIFISAPHRGSELATNWAGRIGASLVKAPVTLLGVANEARSLVTMDTSALHLKRVPNSIDTLAPNSRFVKTINTIPMTPGIPYNSILGDRGKGGNKDRTPPVSTDGIVPYWSSHLDGAQSELIVPSSHSAHQNPQAIQEVRRILKRHASS